MISRFALILALVTLGFANTRPSWMFSTGINYGARPSIHDTKSNVGAGGLGFSISRVFESQLPIQAYINTFSESCDTCLYSPILTGQSLFCWADARRGGAMGMHRCLRV